MSEPGTEDSLAIRQRASREEVLDAAAKAFVERGYAATSIDDVADQLGCTKGRVYHYFRTKGELFLGVHHRALELALDAVRPIVESGASAESRLQEMGSAHALLMMKESSYMRLAVQHAEMGLAMEGRAPRPAMLEVFALRQEYESYFERVIEEGVRNGEFRDVNPNLLAKAALGSLNWISVWYRPAGRGRSKISADQVASEFAEFVVAGLKAPVSTSRKK